MIYKVRAIFIEERLVDFYEKLTNGTINSQRPDGEEMVRSMKRAKLTTTGVVEWFEMCFAQHFCSMNGSPIMIFTFRTLKLNLLKTTVKSKENHLVIYGVN